MVDTDERESSCLHWILLLQGKYDFLCDSILCHKAESFRMRKSISLLCVIPISTNKQEHFLTQLNVLAIRLCLQNCMYCMVPIHQKIHPSSTWVIFRGQNLFQTKAYSPGFIDFKFLVPFFWYLLRKMLCLFSETPPSLYTMYKLRKEFSSVIGKMYTVPLLSSCLPPQTKLCLGNITIIN